MITFKQFMGEAEVTPMKLDKVNLSSEKEAKAFIAQHCSMSIPMFRKRVAVWRGDRSLADSLKQSESAVVNTLSSKRKSENTSNWYTTILDGHPEYSHFPKRSQSVICSTSFHTASGYGGLSGTLAVIPFNDAKIGNVNRNDIWMTKLKMPDGSMDAIKAMNDFFEDLSSAKLGLDENDFDSFKQLDARIKKDKDARQTAINITAHHLYSLDEKQVNAFVDNFYNSVLKMYSLDSTYFSAHASVNTLGLGGMGREGGGAKNELWVGGKILLLTVDTFEQICDWYVNE